MGKGEAQARRELMELRGPRHRGRRVSTPLSLRLRPTMLSDLDFVGSVESDPENLPFITPWERVQHEGAVRFPRLPPLHRRGGAGLSVGRLRHPAGMPQSARLGRAEAARPAAKGQGYGRACVRLLAEMAFRDLHAHRFWLDVKSANVRALALYRSEGFVEEGRLRESVRSGAAGTR
jgi:RimJ/RimL family protein N-acetyltransferase